MARSVPLRSQSDSSSGQVKDSVNLVNQAGASLHEIVTSIRSVADVVAGRSGGGR